MCPLQHIVLIIVIWKITLRYCQEYSCNTICHSKWLVMMREMSLWHLISDLLSSVIFYIIATLKCVKVKVKVYVSWVWNYSKFEFPPDFTIVNLLIIGKSSNLTNWAFFHYNFIIMLFYLWQQYRVLKSRNYFPIGRKTSICMVPKWHDNLHLHKFSWLILSISIHKIIAERRDGSVGEIGSLLDAIL